MSKHHSSVDAELAFGLCHELLQFGGIDPTISNDAQEVLMTEEAERDLCSRVIAAIDDGNSMREAACRLSIAISTRMMASFSA